ncbi:hypothetical protein MK489_24600 [Myxococcota bacterium]|nr:hypothetical protein [Myxococcota bacterium]
MTTEQRFQRLETSLRRQKIVTGSLSLTLVSVFSMGLVTSPAVPDELVINKLTILDDQGRARIVAETEDDGTVLLAHYDANAKPRIAAATMPNGKTEIRHYDPNGKIRIKTGTDPDGTAGSNHLDEHGKLRIETGTDRSGIAGIVVNDGQETVRWRTISRTVGSYPPP